MKIIQSYAKMDYISPYIHNKMSENSHLLNFYSFLLSYITLKELYGNVTMFTNKNGYDSLIRFIPYDEIIILENTNTDKKYWSYYKVNVIETLSNDDFVHVDSDVFMFNDLLKPFINSDCDGIVQDIVTPNMNGYMAGNFVVDNFNKLLKDEIIIDDYNRYNLSYSCGVLGLKGKNKGQYIELSKKIKHNIDTHRYNCNINYYACVCEEVALYLSSIKYGWNITPIIPLSSTNHDATANKIGYTHLFSNSKFRKKNIDLIKKKINTKYSKYNMYVNEFENYLNTNKIILNHL